MNDLLKEMPKIELHLHLDGSMNIDLAHTISNKDYDYLKNNMMVNDKCNSLRDYLKCFDLPISLMQTKKNLQDTLINLANDLVKDNVIYAEVRFAPSLHTSNMTQEEAVVALLEVIDKLPIPINIILCMMRNNDYLTNRETIDIAYKYLNKGVCAIDLAGDEARYKTGTFKDLFKYASKKGIPFTIHAGEADNYKSVEWAIKYGAKRIGHGIQAGYNKYTMKRLKKNKICLEVCIKSNIDTHTVSNLLNHPINYLYEKGLFVTLNTDNRTVSNTNLLNEYKLYLDICGNVDDLIDMNKYAVNAAFISDKLKKQLLDEINLFSKNITKY